MVAKRDESKELAEEFGRLLRLAFHTSEKTKLWTPAKAKQAMVVATGVKPESARKWWKGLAMPQRYRMQPIADIMGYQASVITPKMASKEKPESDEVRENVASYSARNKQIECLEAFEALSDPLQNHMIRKMQDFLWYWRDLPEFLRPKFVPPKDGRYGEWEHQVEADLQIRRQQAAQNATSPPSPKDASKKDSTAAAPNFPKVVDIKKRTGTSGTSQPPNACKRKK